MGTFTPFLSANKKDPISTKMNPRALRSNVTSSTLSGGVDNSEHNHRKEIVAPLIASASGVTPSNSWHNAATSNTSSSDCWVVDTKAKDNGNIL